MRSFPSLIRALGCGLAVAAGVPTVVAAEGNGLVPRLRASSLAQAAGEAAAPVTHAPLRGRFAIGIASPARGLLPGDAPSAVIEVVGGRLLGDYYFTRPRPGEGLARGFRATSGVLFGSRSGTWGAGTAPLSIERRDFGLLPSVSGASHLPGGDTVPYVGIGYSDAFGKGRWGLSADLGLMALRPADGLRLGRPIEAGTGFDDTLRDLRLAPLLQLGVSYSF